MKKVVCLIFCLFLILPLFTAVSAEEKTVLPIGTEEELVDFLTGRAEKRDKAVLENDITVRENYMPGVLSCELDGQGYSVILDNKSTTVFSEIEEGAVVKNLLIRGAVGNKAGEAAAGLCVTNNGTVKNCAVLADFAGKDFMYGICQINNGRLYNCAVLGKPTFNGGVSPYCWFPIVAENNGDATACYYVSDYVQNPDVEGWGFAKSECEGGKLRDQLNARVDAYEGMMLWVGEAGEYPHFDVESVADPSGNGAVIAVIGAAATAVIAGTTVFFLLRKKRIKSK